MRKNAPARATETLRMIAAGALLCLAAFLSCPGRGILSTLPYAPLAGAAAVFVYRNIRFDLAVFALSVFAFSLVESEGALHVAFYVVVQSALFALCYYFTKSLKDRRRDRLLNIAGLILCVSVSVFALGNPVSASLAQTDAVKFYRGRYPNERFFLENTWYDPIARDYYSEFVLKNGERLISPDAGLPHRKDAYWSLISQRAMEKRKAALLQLLHERFSDGTYRIFVSTEFSEAGAVYPNEEVLGDDPERLFEFYDYTVEFDRSFSTAGTREAKSAFAATVRSYVRVLNESGFPYHSITFRGGEREKMLYELSSMPDTPPEELTADRIKILGN